ncbi:LysR family transcriptional regulator [Pseudomonas guariconensis]|uniref:LysR family transcriptional regulator n=1 Tax=Pseudomonas TaxID=286 RepID=UPI001CE44333|nr:MULTISPECIES: LysR family transcriptional regulator [Pseudomonas]MCO7638992.1 LysR family transcriptional regulator [Pseudomonas sp. S 311-6]MCO7516709.1 LysR family transcriptional regulator [Pseudomonas putida]MCO7565645.1 LysR family transcriptional regulator [Pseudomonas mosselii]MCO7596008.1 LysR family transcriptional regulator [Pseudomonas guariconensis]MCO7607064.1 LysR family transcriptional regulator [Pseudomonas guariconensis]
MKIHARSLLYFEKIRQCHSIREAARQLHVDASAVNRQLIKLEETLGAEVFERLPSGLKLTEAGRLLAQHLVTVFQDEQRLKSELEGLKGIRSGNISVVSVEGLNEDFMPVVIEKMISTYPGVKINCRFDGSANIARLIEEGEVDLGLAFSIPSEANLQCCAAVNLKLGAIVQPSHPLASRVDITFADCLAYPLILGTPEIAIYSLMQPLLEGHQGCANVLLQTSSLVMMKKLAQRGMGVAFQTRLGMKAELQEGSLVHLPLRPPSAVEAKLGVYIRKGRALSPSLAAFVNIVSELLRAYETA